ncbi:membrane-associated progesterone receptor component 2 [Gastrophryne carolinensis]
MSESWEEQPPGEEGAAALLDYVWPLLLNGGLLAGLLYGTWRLYERWRGGGSRQQAPLPRMKRRDFSVQQLLEYDGVRNPRILLAINGKVFDVTKGRKYYGPDGLYGRFAGRDASRGLATFCIEKEALRDEYDDLSDLNAVQMESVREWEMQFKEKYECVGRLLKPGEEPSEYTDEEDVRDHSKHD